MNSHFHSCGIELPIVDSQGQVGFGASKSRYLSDKVLGPARFDWMIETGVKVCSGERRRNLKVGTEAENFALCRGPLSVVQG